MKANKRTRLYVMIGVATLAALLLVWSLLVVPAIDKGQSYKGQVVQKIASPRWGHWWSPHDRRTRCYLLIKTDEGKHIRVRVPRHVFTDFAENERVVKVQGERWPRPADKLERHINANEFFNYMKQSGREQ